MTDKKACITRTKESVFPAFFVIKNVILGKKYSQKVRK
jgi:hypothetical protein